VSGTRERQRAGGRSEQVRLAVGGAVLALLAEGRTDFTTAQVAERSGVSRRTIYRWWPDRSDLLTEAIDQHVRTVAVPDTGSWAHDLRTFAHRIAAFAAAPIDLGIARVIASGRHTDLATAVLERYEPVLADWRAMYDRALARGEACDRQGPETVINTLLAPLFLAPLMTGAAPSPDAVDGLVDLVLAATEPQAVSAN